MFYNRLWHIWKTYGPSAFVETGCGPFPHCGMAVAYALEQRIFSCDVNPTWVRSASLRYPGAVVEAGLSTALLPAMCVAAGAARTVFFLDAHFGHLADYANVPDDKIAANSWPVMDELHIIKATKRNVENDFIICDDLRCIVDPANPMYDAAMADSPLGQSQHKLQDYIDVFADTHHATAWTEFEGCLVLYPRSLTDAH